MGNELSLSLTEDEDRLYHRRHYRNDNYDDDVNDGRALPRIAPVLSNQSGRKSRARKSRSTSPRSSGSVLRGPHSFDRNNNKNIQNHYGGIHPSMSAGGAAVLPVRSHHQNQLLHVRSSTSLSPSPQQKRMSRGGATGFVDPKKYHDDESTFAPPPSDSGSTTRSSGATEEDEDGENSLVTYDDDDDEEEESDDEDISGTTATYPSRSTSGRGSRGQRQSLYDTDDVTAMTDMAHDGDDEATNALNDTNTNETTKTSSSHNNKKQKKQLGGGETEEHLTRHEEKRRRAWRKARRRQSGSHTNRDNNPKSLSKCGNKSKSKRKQQKDDDDEETIVIIDADEEFSRTGTMNSNNTNELEDSPTSDKIPAAMAGTTQQATTTDLDEPMMMPSDKENDTEEIVMRVAERAVSEKIKVQFQTDQSTVGNDVAIVENDGPLENVKKHGKDKQDESSRAVPSKTEKSTRSKRKAKARIIVAATEVVPRKTVQHHSRGAMAASCSTVATARPINVVAASNVETGPQQDLKSSSLPTVGDAPQPDVSSSIQSAAKTEINSRRVDQSTSLLLKQTKAIAVVTASDVDFSPQNKTLKRVPLVSAPENDISHSIEPTKPANGANDNDPEKGESASEVNKGFRQQSQGIEALNANSLPQKSNHIVDTSKNSSLETSQSPIQEVSKTRNIRRNVPVVVNGKIVGNSASWLTQRPSPETPTRSRRDDAGHFGFGPSGPSSRTSFHGQSHDHRDATQHDQHASEVELVPLASETTKPLQSELTSIDENKTVESNPLLLTNLDSSKQPGYAQKEDGKCTESNTKMTQTVARQRPLSNGRERGANQKLEPLTEQENDKHDPPDCSNSRDSTSLTVLIPSNLHEDESVETVLTSEKRNEYDAGLPKFSKVKKSPGPDSSKPSRLGKEPEGESVHALNANTQLPPSPNKDRSKPLVKQNKESSNPVESYSNRAHDSVSKQIAVESSIIESDLVPRSEAATHSSATRKTLSSPKPEDARGNDKRVATLLASEGPKLNGVGSSDLQRLESGDYDDGIDFLIVERYEDAFNSILKKHPELTSKNPKVIEMLRVAKLQKILSATLEVESELEGYVQALTVQKQEMTTHYQTKLIDASKKKASREVLLRKSLESAHRAKHALENQLKWQLFTMCHVQTTQLVQLENELLQAQTTHNVTSDPFSILPQPLSAQLQIEMKNAVCAAKVATNGIMFASSLSASKVHQLQEQEMNNALLAVKASVLERKLVYCQASATRLAWVDSVLRRMTSQQRLALKKRFEERVGISVEKDLLVCNPVLPS